MLQQILKDMYIDPDVLEALNEEQKKILFLKMRQEQVRRWKECEEKLEREGRTVLKPKLRKAHAKSVSWLLGCDGDVQVYVIGEADEVKSSKFILSELKQMKGPSQQNNTQYQSNAIRSSLANNRACPEPEEAPSPSQTSQIQLQVNGVQPASDSSPNPPHSQNSGDLKSVSHSPPLEVLQSEQRSSSPAGPEEKDNDDSGPAADSLVGAGIYYRSHLSRDSSPSIADRLRPLDTLRADLQSSIDRLRAQEAQGDDAQGTEGVGSKRLWRNGGRDSLARGRVAQLMKAFGTPVPRQNTLSRRKPPLPSKPAHLLMASSTPR